jgi:hypothetical protein
MTFIAIIVSLVVGFVAGALFFRNNAKKAEAELARVRAIAARDYCDAPPDDTDPPLSGYGGYTVRPFLGGTQS